MESSMPNNKLSKYSLGVGDRFAQEAEPQLAAFEMAAEAGVEITPVWNKSNREHAIIGSEPSETRQVVDAAVKKRGWSKPYFCDADHINLETVDRFLAPCDFFTIDVADLIGKSANPGAIDKFVARHSEHLSHVEIEGLGQVRISQSFLQHAASKYLAAVAHAAEIYRKIEKAKRGENFVTEISMDETDAPQTPRELLVILVAIADHRIPIETIAPKFSGRFNKGVDYAGDVEQFSKEFSDDIAVIRYAARHYGLPEDLKLSVHSGSDKFSIYDAMHRALKESGAGLHLKTAGTTWLEEVIGLAESGGEGLALAKEIYSEAFAHYDELCAPYLAVIDIDKAKLSSPVTVNKWSSQQFTSALRHDPSSPEYNSSFRQLLHIAFKVAAKMANRYLDLLRANRAIVARNVTSNLYGRHIAPVFVGRSQIVSEARPNFDAAAR
jgi:tagaturonate epimerase